MSKHLLVINFCMDPEDPSLAHQYEVVMHLATRFEKVSVITGRQGNVNLPNNVAIKVIDWKTGQKVKNAVRLLSAFFRTCRMSKPNSLFSHMVPIHAAVVSPFSGLLRIPHVLWYAHAAKPKSLLIARMFVSVIASSTSGSCPISGKKVRFIGQGVDCEVFGRRQFRPGYTYRFVYAGRMSQSKNIPLIINELKKARVKHPEITLHLIGNQSELYVNNGNSTWVSAMPALPRENLSSELEKYDVFIHAFVGSLDKVLVEATLKGLPVVTINGEYQKEFLHWDTNLCPTLETELQAFLNANWKSVANHVDSNYEIAIRKHELNGWTDRLYGLLAIAK